MMTCQGREAGHKEAEAGPTFTLTSLAALGFSAQCSAAGAAELPGRTGTGGWRGRSWQAGEDI